MADSVLASAVILGARERADDAVDEAIADDAEILRYLVQAWKRLHALYVQAEPDRFMTSSNVGVVAGTATYSLPATWLGTVRVDYVQSSTGNLYRPLRRLQDPEVLLFNGTPSAPIATAYRAVGTNLVLYPTPSDSSASYRHTYLTTAPSIPNTSTSLEVRNGHDVYLEMLVAKRLLQKEEAYDGRFEKELEQIEEDLKSEANLRYFMDPDRQWGIRQRDPFIDPADYPGRRRYWY